MRPEDIDGLTVGGLLDLVAGRRPEDEALVYADRNLRYTYTEFKEVVEKCARSLMALGIDKGDHVAVWGQNVPEWVTLQFATGKVGAVLVTINPAYKSHELKYVLEQSDAAALFLTEGAGDANFLQILQGAVPELGEPADGELSIEELPFLKHVVLMGGDSPEGLPAIGFDEFLQRGEEVSDEELRERQASLDAEEVINMQYTSGTTGFPKGVQLTHTNIVKNAFYIGECMKLGPEDRVCIPVPFFHCFGCVLGTLNTVTHEGTMVPVESFDAEKVLQAVDQERCTALLGVPTMFIAELEHPDFEQYDTSSLRTGIMAGSPCPMEVMKKVVDVMGASEITIAYGQTESSPVITQTRTDDPLELRVSSVGRKLPDVEVRIVSVETDEDAGPGRAGRVVDSRLPRHARLLQDGGEDQRSHRRRGMAAHGRSRGNGRRWVCQDHGPVEGHDHPRRREHLPARDRGVPLHPPRGLRCPGLRRPRPKVRRKGRRRRKAPRGFRAHGRRCTKTTAARTSPTTKSPSTSTSSMTTR